MVVFYLLIALISLLVYYLINKNNKKFNYWRENGVGQFEHQDFIYGDTKQEFCQEISEHDQYKFFYTEFKKRGLKHAGVYQFNRPVWVPIDPEIIKLVVTKDFQHFSAHNDLLESHNTLVLNNMFHMDGEPWKDIRRKLTPTFTSGKMKMMYHIIHEKAEGLSGLINEILMNKEEITEIKELVARYTTDVIGSCAFGIESNSLKDKNSAFYQNGQDLFKSFSSQPKLNIFRLILIISRLTGVMTFNVKDIEDFFRQLVNETVQYREENKIIQRDFLHLMIQIKNNGSVADLVNEKDIFKKTNGNESALSMEDLTGQCMLFFTAGFETSSTTISFALLELAVNQGVQNKLREEINNISKKHDGILNYDALQEMTFCENVIKETLRKYPPVSALPRLCTKDFELPNTNTVIKKGTIVKIPVLGIQTDADYFYDPEKFIPERFDAENNKTVDYTYMPFGEGPRQCVGLRFGIMQTKCGLVSMIKNYVFTRNEKTKYPVIFAPTSPILAVDGGIWLNIQKVAE